MKEIPIKKRFVHPDRDQLLLLPPDLRDWIEDAHFARWLVKVLERIDFSKFYQAYAGEGLAVQGRPPYSPDLMVGLIFYAITEGALSSRMIEELAYSDIGARFITGNHQPDHACIARFRLRHAEQLGDVFSQIILLCHEAGLVSLKNVALDSTIAKANVAPNSSIKQDKLDESWNKSKARAQEILTKLEAADQADKAEREKLQRQLKNANGRTSRIEQAMEFVKRQQAEAPAKTPSETGGTGSEPADTEPEEARRQVGLRVRHARLAQNLSLMGLGQLTGVDKRRINDIESGRIRPNPVMVEKLAEVLGMDSKELVVNYPVAPPGTVKFKSINITDPDCYLTYKPSKGFIKGYLGQAAVDSKYQIVVDAEISKTNTDRDYLASFTTRCEQRFNAQPETLTSDTGYCSGPNFRLAEEKKIDYYCSIPHHTGKSENSDPDIVRMREKLESPEGKKVYNTRSGVVESLFSRIGIQLGFTRLLYRGATKVSCEWLQMLSAYNLMRWYSVVRENG